LVFAHDEDRVDRGLARVHAAEFAHERAHVAQAGADVPLASLAAGRVPPGPEGVGVAGLSAPAALEDRVGHGAQYAAGFRGCGLVLFLWRGFRGLAGWDPTRLAALGTLA
jgi:hypothetical protein